MPGMLPVLTRLACGRGVGFQQPASIFGSEQESGKPRVFRGFWTFVKLGCRSSRRCGNGETRVLCGFPSSEVWGRNSSREYDQSALGASFPQRNLDFQGFGKILSFLSSSGSNVRPSESRVICMLFQFLAQTQEK